MLLTGEGRIFEAGKQFLTGRDKVAIFSFFAGRDGKEIFPRAGRDGSFLWEMFSGLEGIVILGGNCSVDEKGR